MVVLAGNPHLGTQIVAADQQHIDAVGRDDLLHILQRGDGFHHHHQRTGGVHRCVRLGHREAAILIVRQRAAGRAMTRRRKFYQFDHRARLGGGTHMGGDDAHRAAVQHAADVFRRIGRHPHQRGDADLLGADTDLATGVDRQRVMLQIHIQRVETSGLGDGRDFDGPREAHGHRSHDLPGSQLLLHMVAQDPAKIGHCFLPPRISPAWGQDARRATLYGRWSGN